MRIARVVTIAHSHREADEMEIAQQLSMTPGERRAIVRKLQRRIYGPNPAPLRPRTQRRK